MQGTQVRSLGWEIPWRRLDQICLSFDKGQTTVNFTETAQLMRGSACIYSRKADYLSSPVHQALDFLSDKKRAKQPFSEPEDGTLGEISSRAPQEAAHKFPSVDDLSDSCVNAALRGDQLPSGTPIRLLPDAPVAPDEMNSSPLHSRQGEDFRMNPSPTITLLLEPVGGSLMEALPPRNQQEPGRVEEQPMEVSACGSPGRVLSISQEPGASPEGPAPRSGGAEEKEALEPASWLKETAGPWQGLEPFDSLDSEPFRKGRPYFRKGAVKLQDFHQWYPAAYADHADSRRPWRKGPSFTAMEVLCWKHVREQLETLQKLQRRKEDCQKDSAEDPRAAGDFLESEGYPEPGEDAATEAAAMPVSLRCEELVQKNLELFVTTSKQELIQETELKQHVRDWEDTIQSLLQEQEEHVPFDIHTYGDQVVSRFSSLNHWHPFAKLLAGQPAFEVCRSMLASLQLRWPVDTMSVRLLTYQRAHEHFQT
ncbi:hypothetical protein FD755_015077 [Muntiacus reevesi]|uniref:Condensin-2 complex subunit H2 n=1 Tax=Muntiacus reevesi TaxID=9886 RepID=A0A5N3XH19_MUNRE|nr:hypothetical protein FD755_015077 [Muntiacus reevesi]